MTRAFRAALLAPATFALLSGCRGVDGSRSRYVAARPPVVDVPPDRPFRVGGYAGFNYGPGPVQGRLGRPSRPRPLAPPPGAEPTLADPFGP